MQALPVDVILAPLPGDDPCGGDLRYDRDWDKMVRARGDEGTGEGISDEETTPPNWEALRDLCATLLAERSKDLRIAMYLVEACVRLEGWAGMREGLALVRGLIGRFWDTGLHPRPEPVEPHAVPDYEDRSAALGWLDEKFMHAISRVAYTARAGAKNYGYFDLLDARKTGAKKGYLKPNGDPDEARKKRFDALVASGHISLDMYDEAVAGSQPDRFQPLAELFSQAHAEYQELATLINAKLGQMAPNLSASRSCLDEIAHEVSVIRQRIAPPETPAPTGGPAPATAGVQSPSSGHRFGVPQPSTSTDGSWAEAEALIRSGEVDRGLAQMAMLAGTEAAGRNRFHRKLLLAEICLARGRDVLALSILEELAELIEKHHLAEWEASQLVGGVWSNLYRLYRKNQPDADRTRELYRRISRLDPWLAMSIADN